LATLNDLQFSTACYQLIWCPFSTTFGQYQVERLIISHLHSGIIMWQSFTSLKKRYC